MKISTIIPLLVLLLLCATVVNAQPTQATQPALPKSTSRYNVGNAPGRHRGPDRKIQRFELKGEPALFDGGGRPLGRMRQPVMINVGVGKRMDLDGKGGVEEYMWAWKTETGSGWVAREAIVDPPPFVIELQRNPKPPRESNQLLTVNAAGGTEKLKNLRHTNSQGVIPEGGNQGVHYTGRNPGPTDYVYLLFACPNVQRGGVARDSIPDGGRFIPALDDDGKLIIETMMMFDGGDFSKPVSVTFLYGRPEHGEQYGWVARANIGER